MKLKPGNEAIYKQKHDEIWPEMLAMMKRDGVRNYLDLPLWPDAFRLPRARCTRADAGKPIDPLVWRWWEMMAPYMETNPDFSPVQEAGRRDVPRRLMTNWTSDR